MKLDKDFFVKQRFWIILGVSLPLVIVALLLLATGVASAISQKQDEVNKARDALDKIRSGEPKNERWVEVYHQTDQKIEGKQNDVWAKAWKMQQGLNTWPQPFQAQTKDKYFGDPIDHFERGRFPGVYKEQWEPDLWRLVDPWDPRKNEGSVQFGLGGTAWEQIIMPVRQWVKLPPSDEDIWLAQEDIWVKRELLQVVRDSNNSVGVFREAKEPASKPDPSKLAGEVLVDHKLFTSPYWEAELMLSKNLKEQHFLRGTIKNVSKRRQPLGMYLLVRLSKAQNPVRAPLTVAGEALAVGESAKIEFTDKDFKLEPVDRFDPSGLYGVEQVFNWRTAPVKVINILALGYPAHRFSTRTLKPYPRFAPKPEEGGVAADPSLAGGAPGGALPGDPGAGGPGGPGFARGEGGFPGMMGMDLGKTDNGLNKNRYIDVTTTVRRMPVGMVLVVDQTHVQDVLIAFANSRLRIQTTQVTMQRAHGTVQPAGSEGFDPTGVTGGTPATPGLAYGGRARPGASSPGGGFTMLLPGSGGSSSDEGGRGYRGYSGFSGGLPGMFGSAGFSSTQEAEPEEDLNLVELSLYGIASLYERFPPKPPEVKPEDAAAKTAGAPAEPAAGGAQPATTGTAK